MLDFISSNPNNMAKSLDTINADTAPGFSNLDPATVDMIAKKIQKYDSTSAGYGKHLEDIKNQIPLGLISQSPSDYMRAAQAQLYGLESFSEGARNKNISKTIEQMLRGLAKKQTGFTVSDDTQKSLAAFINALQTKGGTHYGLSEQEARQRVLEGLNSLSYVDPAHSSTYGSLRTHLSPGSDPMRVSTMLPPSKDFSSFTLPQNYNFKPGSVSGFYE